MVGKIRDGVEGYILGGESLYSPEARSRHVFRTPSSHLAPFISLCTSHKTTLPNLQRHTVNGNNSHRNHQDLSPN